MSALSPAIFATASRVRFTKERLGIPGKSFITLSSFRTVACSCARLSGTRHQRTPCVSWVSFTIAVM